ncbi:type II toxin-antitoxin system YoeB family toxin [Candidatus Uhrbacteria bacterium]|nr:type II toxin-antitoxin system YoeB family toxin [Candidatus Uhrbacteria bacterium]
MISVILTEEFISRYQDLPVSIQKKAERREKLFRGNPFNRILHTEKLHPKAREVWSFRIDNNYRILFRFKDATTVYFLTVGPHHWIYRYINL